MSDADYALIMAMLSLIMLTVSGASIWKWVMWIWWGFFLFFTIVEILELVPE